MDIKKFSEVLVDRMKEFLPDEIRKNVDFKLYEITQENDHVYHGLTIRFPGEVVNPSIYVEKLYGMYRNGKSLNEVAIGTLVLYAKSMLQKPEKESIPLEFEKIKDRVVFHLAEAERNKEFLKDVIYKPVGNGFVMVCNAIIKENEDGCMKFAVSKDMARAEGYDIDSLLDYAMRNTIEKYEPVFMAVGQPEDIFRDIPDNSNPMKAGFHIDTDNKMLVLTNNVKSNGAAVLFYPEMQKKLGEIIGSDYYLIPSSIHEMIVVPKDKMEPLEDMKSAVRTSNTELLAKEDVLSDRIFMYDRSKDRLMTADERDMIKSEIGER